MELNGKQACVMPDSYDLGHGHTEPCPHCDYSYGRYFEPCDEFFQRNGCCVCTPYCPHGMVMSYWTWPKPTPKENALEPRQDFDIAPAKDEKPHKQIDQGDNISGYVCLIHEVEY